MNHEKSAVVKKAKNKRKNQKHYMIILDVIAHILSGNRPRRTRHASRWKIGVGAIVIVYERQRSTDDFRLLLSDVTNCLTFEPKRTHNSNSPNRII